MKKLLSSLGIFAMICVGAVDDLGMTAEVFRDEKNFDGLLQQRAMTK